MKKFSIPFRSGSRSERSSVSREASSVSSALPSLPELPEIVSGSAEDKIVANIKAFCEPQHRQDPNEPESSYLPGIIEPAEASPAAAAWAARKILEYFPEPDDQGQGDPTRNEPSAGWKKDKRRKGKFNGAEPPIMYNAINLLGLLSAHPGKPFTQHLNNERAVGSVKAILVHERDPSVQQILREELNKLDGASRLDNNLEPMVQMWNEEKKRTRNTRQPYPNGRQFGHPAGYGAPAPFDTFRQPSHQEALPAPDELAGRTHEAIETAKLLIQMSQASAPEVIESDEMIGQMAERTRRASRSFQGYIDSTSPRPDNDTMHTLINTYQAVNVALIKHWQAVLSARKTLPPQQPQQPPQQNAQQQRTWVDWASQRSSQPPQTENAIPQSSGPTAQENTFTNSTQPIQQPQPIQPQQVPQRKPYSLFNSSNAQPQRSSPIIPPTQTRPQPAPVPGETLGSRYNPNYRPTQSYIARQDAAVGSMTMHGASPPPQEETAAR